MEWKSVNQSAELRFFHYKTRYVNAGRGERGGRKERDAEGQRTPRRDDQTFVRLDNLNLSARARSRSPRRSKSSRSRSSVWQFSSTPL